ncbi:MAG: tyrosine-type recombinase/integrase [Clostridia bacterium]|nr:tyrosine-type recombinase/integrase [Clostridia bacterium]
MATYKKRSDGRYQTRIFTGYDSEGKKQFKYIYAKTIPELKKKETELRSQYDKGIDITSVDDTFNQWLQRLLNSRRTELSDSEYRTLSSRAEVFADEVGTLPLKNINQQNLQPIINKIFLENPATGKQTSKRTLQRYISVVSSVFEYAIENRAADFNPCRYLKIPKQAVSGERRALTPTERKWVEEFPHRAQTAAMLMMYSGLRRGEATALLWNDIDFEKKTITVNKSYDFKNNQLKLPKTTAGIRTVSVPDKLIDYLKGLEKKSLYVLTSAQGKMMTNASWQKLWESYMIDLNIQYGNNFIKRNKSDPRGQIITIEPFSPHCLRHTFCTIMYEAGIDVLTAKEQMGHTDVKTTLAIYTHLDSQHKQKNISKLNDYLKTGTD